MPPRFSLRPLARKLQAPAAQPRAPISYTSKNAGLKDLGAAARDLTNFDDSATTTGTPSPSGPSPSDPYRAPGAAGEALSSLMQSADGYKGIARTREAVDEKFKEQTARGDLARQMTRSWRDGDVYAPHDLSDVEMMKWKQPKRPNKDVIDMLGLNPLDHYKNFAIISEFMTDMGRIKHSKETGLRPVNQRKMAKAIRRAIGMGIHPSTHRHPQIIFGETKAGPRYQNTRLAAVAKDTIKVK